MTEAPIFEHVIDAVFRRRGLQCDRLATQSAVDQDLRIVTVREERLKP